MSLSPKWSVSHMGILCRIHRRLHVFWLLECSLTIMYKILLCTYGDGLQLASVILYRYYHYYLLIVWTVSVLVGCVVYVWHLYRYFCTLLVCAQRIWHALPYGALTSSTLFGISILFECWCVCARVHFYGHGSIAMNIHHVVRSCTQTLWLWHLYAWCC